MVSMTGTEPKGLQGGAGCCGSCGDDCAPAPGTFSPKGKNTPGKEARQPAGNPAKGGRKGTNGAYGTSGPSFGGLVCGLIMFFLLAFGTVQASQGVFTCTSAFVGNTTTVYFNASSTCFPNATATNWQFVGNGNVTGTQLQAGTIQAQVMVAPMTWVNANATAFSFVNKNPRFMTGVFNGIRFIPSGIVWSQKYQIILRAW